MGVYVFKWMYSIDEKWVSFSSFLWVNDNVDIHVQKIV